VGKDKHVHKDTIIAMGRNYNNSKGHETVDLKQKTGKDKTEELDALDNMSGDVNANVNNSYEMDDILNLDDDYAVKSITKPLLASFKKDYVDDQALVAAVIKTPNEVISKLWQLINTVLDKYDVDSARKLNRFKNLLIEDIVNSVINDVETIITNNFTKDLKAYIANDNNEFTQRPKGVEDYD
jgi:hypothetical protein